MLWGRASGPAGASTHTTSHHITSHHITSPRTHLRKQRQDRLARVAAHDGNVEALHRGAETHSRMNTVPRQPLRTTVAEMHSRTFSDASFWCSATNVRERTTSSVVTPMTARGREFGNAQAAPARPALRVRLQSDMHKLQNRTDRIGKTQKTRRPNGNKPEKHAVTPASHDTTRSGPAPAPANTRMQIPAALPHSRMPLRIFATMRECKPRARAAPLRGSKTPFFSSTVAKMGTCTRDCIRRPRVAYVIAQAEWAGHATRTVEFTGFAMMRNIAFGHELRARREHISSAQRAQPPRTHAHAGTHAPRTGLRERPHDRRVCVEQVVTRLRRHGVKQRARTRDRDPTHTLARGSPPAARALTHSRTRVPTHARSRQPARRARTHALTHTRANTCSIEAARAHYPRLARHAAAYTHIRMRAHGDMHIRMRAHGDMHIRMRAHGDMHIRMRAHGDMHIRTRAWPQAVMLVRTIPGLRGTPAGITTTSAPARDLSSSSAPLKPVTCAHGGMHSRMRRTHGGMHSRMRRTHGVVHSRMRCNALPTRTFARVQMCERSAATPGVLTRSYLGARTRGGARDASLCQPLATHAAAAAAAAVAARTS